MMTPAERYKTDPVFHQLVDLFSHQFRACDQSGAGLTPTEIREASAFAWQMYVERYCRPTMMIPMIPTDEESRDDLAQRLDWETRHRSQS